MTELVNVMRGEVVESVHSGFVAVANGRGELIASAGNADFVTYMRSAAKPIQALNVLLSGAAERFGFTSRELAVMCSSHYGMEMHRETVRGILRKINLTPENLLCGAPLSINQAYRERQLRENMPLDNTCSDCSGKHSGFLAVCVVKGYPIESYDRPEHPMQREVLEIIAHMCGMRDEDIKIGVDGCGVPVHAMPLRNMAQSYARLTTPEQLDEPYRSACKRITDAMAECPEMVAGPGGFCTELLRCTGGRLTGKLGAEASYSIGVRGADMGITVKIADGNYRALYPAVMSVLKQLDLLTTAESEHLSAFAEPDNLNDHGNSVGKLLPCFKLA